MQIPKPNYNLDIHGGDHGAMTGRMMMALEPVVVREKPDLVLVYGDTNSTLAGALVAAKLNLPLAHVESGLRSFNRAMPEEVNRVLTDHVSNFLFCPTRTSVDNLRNEGLTRGIYHVGDVMYDATLYAMARAKSDSIILEDLGLQDGDYAVATLHRQENTCTPEALSDALDWLKASAKSQPVVFPLHPRTQQAAEDYGLNLDGLLAVAPVGLIDLTRLLMGSTAVFTDSSGLQKEAYFHRKECVTLRDETEWVETIEMGWNRLWTVNRYEERRDITDYGEGRSAEKVVQILREQLLP